MKSTQARARTFDLPWGDGDTDTLDALVDSSRRLGRFWPPLEAGPEPAPAAPAGVSVPVRTQRLVAGMPEYGD